VLEKCRRGETPADPPPGAHWWISHEEYLMDGYLEIGLDESAKRLNQEKAATEKRLAEVDTGKSNIDSSWKYFWNAGSEAEPRTGTGLAGDSFSYLAFSSPLVGIYRGGM